MARSPPPSSSKNLLLLTAPSVRFFLSLSLPRSPLSPRSPFPNSLQHSLLGRGSGASVLAGHGEGIAAPRLRRRCCRPSSLLRPPPLALSPLQAPPPLPPLLPLLRPHHRRRLASFPAPAAKKGGGGKGGGGQKKGPSLIPKEKPPYATVDAVMLTLLLVESFRRAVGRPLIGGGPEDDSEEGGLEISAAPRALYEFPCAVLAHDRFSCGEGEEPKFTYANLAAQKVFEASWGELVGMESRKSAELDDAAAQEDRRGLLDRAAATGEAQTGYRGWRVSAKGTKFEIQDGVLFNVKSPSGEDVGQAVVFGHWKYEDGSEGGPNAPSTSSSSSPPDASAAAAAASASPPAQSLEAAEAAVAEQAAAVRALKDSGKANADPEVSAAVEELLRRKAVVAGIKGE